MRLAKSSLTQAHRPLIGLDAARWAALTQAGPYPSNVSAQRLQNG